MNAPLTAEAYLTESGLFQMQLKIARRADEILKSSEDRLKGDLFALLQAEREILAPMQPVCAKSDALLASATS